MMQDFTTHLGKCYTHPFPQGRKNSLQATQLAEAAKKIPLLKWTGGKRKLLRQILPFVPEAFSCYYEPFLGGGAVFFAIEPRSATLSDLNSELISCYTQIRDSPEEVIQHLGGLVNSEDDYYRIRNSYPLSEAERAARLIYLTTLSFNGIFRQNRFGVFNVPYGHKTHVVPCDANKIRSASRLLATATLITGDFEGILRKADKGDFLYLDPPYTVAHENNGFVKYNAKIFSWEDQERLAKLAKNLSDKGCHLIISNANHESIRELYSHFTLEIIDRNSIIAASSGNRRLITECIFHNRA